MAQVMPRGTNSKLPFVMLAHDSDGELPFATLSEALISARSGDTIEIRDNGPFSCPPFYLTLDKALVIRAAEGFSPVIRLEGDPAANSQLLGTAAPLVMEGLEIQCLEEPSKVVGSVINCTVGPLHVANCRFVLCQDNPVAAVLAANGAGEVRNCQFLCGQHVIACSWTIQGQLHLENNVLAGINVLDACEVNPLVSEGQSFRLNDNTIQSQMHFSMRDDPARKPLTGAPPLDVESSGNVFDPDHSLISASFFNYLSPSEAEERLRRHVSWSERGNAYGELPRLLSCCVIQTQKDLSVASSDLPPTRQWRSVADWEQFWGGTPTGSLQGRIRYQGGDIQSKLARDPTSVTPDAFRLAAGSAGKGAGKDGRDLGANIDLVGPGKAYEKWKQTTAYQEWLKETKQVK